MRNVLKNLVVLLMCSGVLMTCKNDPKSNGSETEAETETVTESSSDTKKAVPKGDTSENALDWNGQYKGILPCADCEGIATSLTLKADGTFQRVQFYNGKSESAEVDRGDFSWSDDGSIVRLDLGEGLTQSYKVGENQVWHLDVNEHTITGDLAEQYILKKNRMDYALENRTWILTEIMGQEVVLKEGQKQAYLVFNSENAMLSGNNGCNQISMGYELLEGKRFKLAPGISTLMACPYENISDQLSEVLGKADNYTVANDELHLNKARMAPLAKFKLSKDE